MVVLVLGGFGQVGQAIQHISDAYPDIIFTFKSSKDADVTEPDSLQEAFIAVKPDFCINAAAYTAVDKAESDAKSAVAINTLGVSNVAEVCKKFDVVLLHISTDYVFDGTKDSPYHEDDETNPQTIYGKTKLEGEIAIENQWNKHFIIRTSWLYSQFGNNFMLTMINLADRQQPVNVVNDQIGTPTHALELARFLIAVVRSRCTTYGIYHFSNEGSATWFEFASEIFKLNNKSVQINPVETEFFQSAAARPRYSVLDKSKIKSEFNLEIRNWNEALNHYRYS